MDLDTMSYAYGDTVWTDYYFAKNLQGDVLAVYAASDNTCVAAYTYDAWGNVLTTTGSMASTLGETNPLRYRGYVYDEETRLYYLQSRYYDPEIGRFINADAYTSTGQGLLSNNMFTYCINNPVSLSDPRGTIPFYDDPIQKAVEDFFQWYWGTDEDQTDKNGKHTTSAKIKKTINSFVQNLEFSAGVGVELGGEIEVFSNGWIL